MLFDNISIESNKNDELPILKSVITIDLLLLMMLKNNIIESHVLHEWYNNYNVLAVITDVMIVFFCILATRQVYPYVFKKTYFIVPFIFVAGIIVAIHDFIIYLILRILPTNIHPLLDEFKRFAKDSLYPTVMAHICMIIMSSLLASTLLRFYQLP